MWAHLDAHLAEVASAESQMPRPPEISSTRSRPRIKQVPRATSPLPDDHQTLLAAEGKSNEASLLSCSRSAGRFCAFVERKWWSRCASRNPFPGVTNVRLGTSELWAHLGRDGCIVRDCEAPSEFHVPAQYAALGRNLDSSLTGGDPRIAPNAGRLLSGLRMWSDGET